MTLTDFFRKTIRSFTSRFSTSGSKPRGINGKENYRRKLIKQLVILPVIGPFFITQSRSLNSLSFEEKNLFERLKAGRTRADADGAEGAGVDPVKLPQAKIGKESFSRMILGGNLIGGWAHARDLLYVSKLVTTYFTDEKIFETFAMAEKYGINSFLTNPVLIRVINKYWNKGLGKIKFISDCGAENIMDGIRVSIDNGASACYIHGGMADRFVENGKIEEIGRGLELIRQNGLPAGIGGHKLQTVKACVDYGLEPDFWMKTLHPTDYWSASPKEKHDNIWCLKPEETVSYMKSIKQPWIGYKILAAGAVEPARGFRYAFENGADFICVGMFDFQIAEDAKLAMDVLDSDLQRERPWRA